MQSLSKTAPSTMSGTPPRSFFPPLISAMDVFLESASEERALDSLEAVRLGGASGGAGALKKKGKKAKKKRLASSDTSHLPDSLLTTRAHNTNNESLVTTRAHNMHTHNPSPTTVPHNNNNDFFEISPSNNAADRIFTPPGAVRTRDRERDREKEREQEPVSFAFPSTPRTAAETRKAGPTPRSAPRAGRTYKASDPVVDASAEGSTLITKDTVSFNKAIESIAALKLHNYAMRRRQNMSQKLKLMKEIRSLEKENQQDSIIAQKVKTNEAVAAWKIRYYVEYLRLLSTQHIVNVVEEKNQQLEQSIQELNAANDTLKHDIEDRRILQERVAAQLQSSREEEKRLQREKENLEIDLAATRKELQHKCEMLHSAHQGIEQEKSLQREDLAKMEVLKSELNITRLTCQEMVKNNAHKDSMLDEFELKTTHLEAALSSAREEIKREKDAHAQELAKLHREKRDAERKLEEKVVVEKEISDRETLIAKQRDAMQALEVEIAKKDREIDDWKDALQSETIRHVKEAEQAVIDKERLQRVMTDLALQLKIAQDELRKQMDKNISQERVIEELRGAVQQRDNTILELQSLQKETRNEVDFLSAENEELTQKTELLTMQNEEAEERHRILQKAHKKSEEYKVYLEEELFFARKHRDKQIAASLAASSTVEALSMPEDHAAGGVPLTAVDANANRHDVLSPLLQSQHSLQANEDDDLFTLYSSLSNNALGSEASSTPLRGVTPSEQKLISIVSALEEKMDSMNRAAVMLQEMMEHTEGLEKAQARRRLTALQHKIVPPPQHETKKEREKDVGSETDEKSHGKKDHHQEEKEKEEKVNKEREAENEKQRLRQLEEEERVASLVEYEQLQEVHLEIEQSIEQINVELEKQREDIQQLQELRNKCKADISQWKKMFKKTHRREATEEDKEREISPFLQQIDVIRDQISAYKVNNLQLHAKAIALQSELQNLQEEIGHSAKEFKERFGEDIDAFSQRHKTRDAAVDGEVKTEEETETITSLFTVSPLTTESAHTQEEQVQTNETLSADDQDELSARDKDQDKTLVSLNAVEAEGVAVKESKEKTDKEPYTAVEPKEKEGEKKEEKKMIEDRSEVKDDEALKDEEKKLHNVEKKESEREDSEVKASTKDSHFEREDRKQPREIHTQPSKETETETDSSPVDIPQKKEALVVQNEKKPEAQSERENHNKSVQDPVGMTVAMVGSQTNSTVEYAAQTQPPVNTNVSEQTQAQTIAQTQNPAQAQAQTKAETHKDAPMRAQPQTSTLTDASSQTQAQQQTPTQTQTSSHTPSETPTQARLPVSEALATKPTNPGVHSDTVADTVVETARETAREREEEKKKDTTTESESVAEISESVPSVSLTRATPEVEKSERETQEHSKAKQEESKRESIREAEQTKDEEEEERQVEKKALSPVSRTAAKEMAADVDGDFERETHKDTANNRAAEKHSEQSPSPSEEAVRQKKSTREEEALSEHESVSEKPPQVSRKKEGENEKESVQHLSGKEDKRREKERKRDIDTESPRNASRKTITSKRDKPNGEKESVKERMRPGSALDAEHSLSLCDHEEEEDLLSPSPLFHKQYAQYAQQRNPYYEALLAQQQAMFPFSPLFPSPAMLAAQSLSSPSSPQAQSHSHSHTFSHTLSQSQSQSLQEQQQQQWNQWQMWLAMQQQQQMALLGLPFTPLPMPLSLSLSQHAHSAQLGQQSAAMNDPLLSLSADTHSLLAEKESVTQNESAESPSHAHSHSLSHSAEREVDNGRALTARDLCVEEIEPVREAVRETESVRETEREAVRPSTTVSAHTRNSTTSVPSPSPSLSASVPLPSQPQPQPLSTRNRARGLQSSLYQQRAQSHAHTQRLRAQLAQAKGDFERELALLTDHIEEIDLLELTRQEVKRELLQWHEQFFSLNECVAEPRDKERSRVYQSLVHAYTETQEALKKKCEEAKPVRERVMEKKTILESVHRELGNISAASGSSRDEEWASLYVVPAVRECVEEDPYSFSFDPETVFDAEEEERERLTLTLPLRETERTTQQAQTQTQSQSQTEAQRGAQREAATDQAGTQRERGTHTHTAREFVPPSPSLFSAEPSLSFPSPFPSPSLAHSHAQIVHTSPTHTYIHTHAHEHTHSPGSVHVSIDRHTDREIEEAIERDREQERDAHATLFVSPFNTMPYVPPTQPGLQNAPRLISDMSSYWQTMERVHSEAEGEREGEEPEEEAQEIVEAQTETETERISESPTRTVSFAEIVSGERDSERARSRERESEQVRHLQREIERLRAVERERHREEERERERQRLQRERERQEEIERERERLREEERLRELAVQRMREEEERERERERLLALEREREAAKLRLQEEKEIKRRLQEEAEMRIAEKKEQERETRRLREMEEERERKRAREEEKKREEKESERMCREEELTKQLVREKKEKRKREEEKERARRKEEVAREKEREAEEQRRKEEENKEKEKKKERQREEEELLALRAEEERTRIGNEEKEKEEEEGRERMRAEDEERVRRREEEEKKRNDEIERERQAREERDLLKRKEEERQREQERGAKKEKEHEQSKNVPPVVTAKTSPEVPPLSLPSPSSSPVTQQPKQQQHQQHQQQQQQPPPPSQTQPVVQREPKKTVYGHLTDYDLFKTDASPSPSPSPSLSAAKSNSNNKSFDKGRDPSPLKSSFSSLSTSSQTPTLHELLGVAPSPAVQNISPSREREKERKKSRTVSFEEANVRSASRSASPAVLMSRLSHETSSASPVLASEGSFMSPGERDGERDKSKSASRPSTTEATVLQLQAEYKALKKELKRWKAEFIQAHGREPAVSDFGDLDHALKVKIARKNHLKKVLESNGLSSSASSSSRKAKRPASKGADTTYPVAEDENFDM